MSDYELTYTPKSWDEEPAESLAEEAFNELDQLRRDIPDDSANVLDFPNRHDKRRHIKRVGPVYRRGSREVVGVSLMYQNADGRCGNRVFYGDTDELVAIANEVLAIAGIEVLE